MGVLTFCAVILTCACVDAAIEAVVESLVAEVALLVSFQVDPSIYASRADKFAGAEITIGQILATATPSMVRIDIMAYEAGTTVDHRCTT